MNESKLKGVISKMAVEQRDLHGPPDELSNKRAQFFAKTILNAKNVAEHFFEEEMDKYKINKDHDDKKK